MSKKIPVSGGQGLASNAFGSLVSAGLPVAPAPAPAPTPPANPETRRGRVHLRVEKSGRSGKTVTVLFGDGVESLDAGEAQALLKALKAGLGCGGAPDGPRIELQGDVRERATSALRERGFQVR